MILLNRFGNFLIVLCVVLLFSGCGYHVVDGPGADGAQGGGGRGALSGIKSLSIPVFENGTRRPGVEAVISRAVVDEFVNTVEIARVGKGEARLKGRVLEYRLDPVSYGTGDIVSEYRLTVTLSIVLLRTSNGEVLWRDDSISDYEDFMVDRSSVAATKDAEHAALTEMAFKLSRLLRERILTDF